MKIHIMPLWNGSNCQQNRLLICFALTAVFFCGSVSAEMRIWEDKSGISVQAEFVRELFGSVELKKPDGSRYSIPLENLSTQDMKYLRSRMPPEIELDVRTQKRGKVRNKEFVQESDVINVVTATVEIRQKSSAAYSGTLRAEVYLIGKEVATDDYRLSGKGTSQVQLTEANKRTFTFETSADFRVYEEYNKLETRGAEYDGYLVVVFDSLGNKLATKTDLSWLEEGEIDALRKFNIDSFFGENCRKRSVPRPRYSGARQEF